MTFWDYAALFTGAAFLAFVFRWLLDYLDSPGPFLRIDLDAQARNDVEAQRNFILRVKELELKKIEAELRLKFGHNGK